MDRNIRIKRIRIISTRRGSKELDLIFGRFIDSDLSKIDDVLLSQFEGFLELNDSDLYDYFFSERIPPEKFKPIFSKILLTATGKM